MRRPPGGLLAVCLGLGVGAALAAAAAPAPDRGGGPRVLRLARTADPQTLDPVRLLMAEDFMLSTLLHLPLLDIVDGTNVVPCAAVRWSRSEDARRFTFELRPGLRFANGRRVVAKDYVYTLERMCDPRSAAMLFVYLEGLRGFREYASGRTNRLTGVETPDERTLVVELERSDPTFPYLMAQPPGMAVPREERERGDYAVRSVGCGPYRVAEWVRGVRLVLEPNPHYAGEAPVHFDRIDILIGGDETTHLMMFERGELDLANITGVGVPMADLPRLSRDPRWAPWIEVVPLFNATYVSLNVEIPPLDNVKVRQALNFAVDKPRRILSTSRKYQAIAGALPPGLPGHDPGLRGYPFDPERAKRLLAESGVGLPLRLTLWHSLDQDMQMVAQGLQADLRDAGVEVELKPVNYAELIQAAQVRGRVPMCLSGWNVSLPDPKDMLGVLFDGRSVTNPATQNLSFYNNPEVNRLLDEASGAVDLPSRFALYRRAERLVVEDAPWLFLGSKNLFALRQPWVKGPLIEPIWWYRFDRIWMER